MKKKIKISELKKVIKEEFMKEFGTDMEKNISDDFWGNQADNFDPSDIDSVSNIEDDNDEYNTIINNLKDNDEILEAAKSFYNKYTTEINLLIKKFPTNVIAKFHKIKLRNYFDGKNMFDDEIKDFKL